MHKNKYLPFYFIVLALFIGLTAKSLFTGGMFMDGLWYAVIARNLSDGIGSFWDLSFSKTMYVHFHEHPPLAFGLQSIFFTLFGDHILVERFYSFFTFLITGWIMVLIWKRTVDKKYSSLAWLPLFFWVITPLITWCVSNNLLENTMMIFTSLAVLFIIKSHDDKRWLNLSLAGVMLYLGFLTKGPVALFPLSLPFWILIINRNISFKRFVIDTLVISIAALAPVLIIYLIQPESIESLMAYFEKQVVGSLKNIQSVESRFYILENLLSNLIPVGILMLIAFLVNRRIKFENKKSKWAFSFFALGLSGVIPIMVSMKQSSFYMLAAIPFFCLAFADVIAPRVHYFTDKINYKGKGYRRFRWISYVLLTGTIIVTAVQTNRVDRDVVLVSDVKKVIEIVHDDVIITIPHEMSDYWNLHGYFQRYAKVSLDYDHQFDNKYLLVIKGYKGDLLEYFTKYPVELELYDLYVKEVP